VKTAYPHSGTEFARYFGGTNFAWYACYAWYCAYRI